MACGLSCGVPRDSETRAAASPRDVSGRPPPLSGSWCRAVRESDSRSPARQGQLAPEPKRRALTSLGERGDWRRRIVAVTVRRYRVLTVTVRMRHRESQAPGTATGAPRSNDQLAFKTDRPAREVCGTSVPASLLQRRGRRLRPYSCTRTSPLSQRQQQYLRLTAPAGNADGNTAARTRIRWVCSHAVAEQGSVSRETGATSPPPSSPPPPPETPPPVGLSSLSPGDQLVRTPQRRQLDGAGHFQAAEATRQRRGSIVLCAANRCPRPSDFTVPPQPPLPPCQPDAAAL